jgi:hypothetical protein
MADLMNDSSNTGEGEEARALDRLRAALSPRVMGAAAVFAAGLLLAEVNLLSSRHFFRTDVSEGGKYTLTHNTRKLVEHLKHPVKITVLLGAADAHLLEVQHTLTAYRAISPLIEVDHVDPDRDTAEFLHLSRKFDLGAQAAEDGGVVAEAALMVQSRKQTWFIRAGQLSSMDSEGGVSLRIEERLTDAIARVQESEKSRICFVTGHGEHSIEDGGPEGLLELGRRLTRSNLLAERVPLDVPDPQAAIASCDALAVMGPARPWPPEHEKVLLERIQRGAHAVFFLDPLVDEEGRIGKSGLENVLREVGAIADPAFVLETAPELRLPSGIGEAFFATPKTHPLTVGLTTDSARLDSRVVLVASQPVRSVPGSATVTVLESSPRAVSINDLTSAGTGTPDEGKTYSLALAGELPTKESSARRRVVIAGTSNVAQNRSFRDPALYGSRRFTENTFSWLTQRPALVSVRERAPVRAGLKLTEESLNDLMRYVLIYMPLTAIFAGVFVLTRRRRKEEKSREGGSQS